MSWFPPSLALAAAADLSTEFRNQTAGLVLFQDRWFIFVQFRVIQDKEVPDFSQERPNRRGTGVRSGGVV